ncbi:hypothetical protein CQA37_05355 [Helicobacter sp. MIT 99-10781]|nr:hypothetical protein CQA37_05355 [Helicobacter sp. MIT 99-10781]
MKKTSKYFLNIFKLWIFKPLIMTKKKKKPLFKKSKKASIFLKNLTFKNKKEILKNFTKSGIS